MIFGRRDAVGVLQHRIERDGVVLLRQVLADRHHAGAVAEQLAIGAVVFGAPRQAADLHAMHRGHHRVLAAGELERVAAHEPAGAVGLVELLAPDAVARTAIAVQRLVELAGDPRVGMEHQVLADQAGGIGEAVGEARDAEFSRMRAVPTALQARITTSAGWNCSMPSAS